MNSYILSDKDNRLLPLFLWSKIMKILLYNIIATAIVWILVLLLIYLFRGFFKEHAENTIRMVMREEFLLQEEK